MSHSALNNFKLTIAYDGTNFLGWQKTKEGRSVEEVLENALKLLVKDQISLKAASRTDAGVHAIGQVVSFCSHQKPNINKLNSLISPEISILGMEVVPTEFHPSHDCKEKEYHYTICHDKAQLPKERLYSWHFPFEIDIELMKKAALEIIGKRDFRYLSNKKKNETYENTIRDVKELVIESCEKNRLYIRIKSDRFLYNMARNIVGLLVQIGRGKIFIDEIQDILNGNKRPKIGITAPPHGLTLFKTYY